MEIWYNKLFMTPELRLAMAQKFGGPPATPEELDMIPEEYEDARGWYAVEYDWYYAQLRQRDLQALGFAPAQRAYKDPHREWLESLPDSDGWPAEDPSGWAPGPDEIPF